jgi:general secretion pathway protein G
MPQSPTDEQEWGWLEYTIAAACVSLLTVVIFLWVFVLPNYRMAKTVSVAKATRVNADVGAIRTMLLSYRGINGFYPTTQQGLQALVVEPKVPPKPIRWTQMMDGVPTDPWGQEYIYRCPGTKNPSDYDVFSAGPDGKPDTADDDWGN